MLNRSEFARNFVSAGVGLWCLLSMFSISSAKKATNSLAVAKTYAQDRVAKVYGANVGRTPGYGTGLIVGAEGQVLTANGTYLNGERVRVVLPNGTSHLATIQKRSRTEQLALLKLNVTTPAHFDLSKTTSVFKGQWVLSFSNLFKIAEGADPTSVMLGIVSLQTKLEAKRGNQPFPYEGDVLLLDCISSNPGAPGGALVDAQTGELVGMLGPNLESRSSGTKLNYAIPNHVLHGFLHSESSHVASAITLAQQSKNPTKVYLGIRLFRLGGKRSPAYIDRVATGSPADRAKLRPDDVILGIGDERVKTIQQYDEVVATLKSGLAVELAVKRGQKLLRITVEPESTTPK